MGGQLNSKFLYSSWQRDRLDPVIVGGGPKLSLNHLVPPALGSVLKSVRVREGVCVGVAGVVDVVVFEVLGVFAV